MTNMFKILLVGIMFFLAACAATPTAVSTPSRAIEPTATATGAAAGVTQVSDNENGKTISVKPGGRVRVVLNSTYWTFQGSSDSQTLQPIGEPTVAPDTSVKIPGIGAGTVTLEFQALKAGTAKISASRVSCGEALLCPEDKRSFQVTVVVAP